MIAQLTIFGTEEPVDNAFSREEVWLAVRDVVLSLHRSNTFTAADVSAQLPAPMRTHARTLVSALHDLCRKGVIRSTPFHDDKRLRLYTRCSK